LSRDVTAIVQDLKEQMVLNSDYMEKSKFILAVFAGIASKVFLAFAVFVIFADFEGWMLTWRGAPMPARGTCSRGKTNSIDLYVTSTSKEYLGTLLVAFVLFLVYLVYHRCELACQPGPEPYARKTGRERWSESAIHALVAGGESKLGLIARIGIAVFAAIPVFEVRSRSAHVRSCLICTFVADL
jgi:hypothetical protein